MSSNRIVVALAGCLVASAFSFATVYANPVSLPFSENFQSVAPSSNAAADYPEFTATGPAQTRTVDATGVLRLGTASNPPANQFFTVTPAGYAPGSELVVKIDMGFDGQAGFGATALALGANTIVFHPGYNGPPGAFRVEGPGGIGSTDMGWVPPLGVLNHVEVDSFPSGLFNIKVTDGSNPANVFTANFTNLASYGGGIGPSSIGTPAAIFDNFTIQAVPEPSSIVILVGMAGICFSASRRGWYRDRG